MFYLRRALWALWSLGVAADMALAAVAIWTQIGRLGGLAFFFGCGLLAGLVALSCWGDEATYEKPLPRKERRELKREESRLRLEQRIRELERELRS